MFKVLTLCFAVWGLIIVCGPEPGDGMQTNIALTGHTSGSKSLVTPVAGPSWLHRLGLSLSQTHMGQMGGTGTFTAASRQDGGLEARGRAHSGMGRVLLSSHSAVGEPADVLDKSFTVTGKDLYRLNCQSCHGPSGKGYPPEINSLIGPVQGASEAMIQRHMKERGTEISDEMAKEMAAEAEKSLRDRLQHGGKSMPSFDHLRGDEVETLLAYLDQLTGVPAGHHAAKPVTESGARIGEHMVKGTCHICHDATGPGGGHMAMMRGIIPSLASIPEELYFTDVAQQVRHGSSGMMRMMGGPRMPAFPYMSEEEIAPAYFYLQEYPPRP